MKKILSAALIATTLISTQALAEGSDMYVGVDIGNTAATLTASAGSVSATEEDDGGSQTIKVGSYLDNNSRVYGYFQNINIDDGTGYTFGAGYDYLFGENDFKPFIGAIIGYGSISDKDSIFDVTGLVYGVQAGIIYNINNNFSVEAGYRYLLTGMQDTVTFSGTDIDLEIDDITNLFIGANYKF